MGEALGSNWFEQEPEIDRVELSGLENNIWTVFGGEYDSRQITISPERLAKINRETSAYPDSARHKAMALELVEYAVELSDPRLHLDDKQAEEVKAKIISAVIAAAKFSVRRLNSEVRDLANELEEHETPAREALRDIINTYNLVFDGEQLDGYTVALSQGTLSMLAINERGISDELPESDSY